MRELPSSDSSLDREPTPLERAALAWVVRCDRGLTRTEEAVLGRWLAEDARHREMFAEFGGTWAAMEGATLTNAVGTSRAPVVLGAGETGRKAAHSRVHWLWVPVAAAAAVAFVVLRWEPGVTTDVRIATPVGGQRQQTLPDGSSVTLNTGSAVVTTFTAGERRVRLEHGEAFFEVAKDTARPFVVEAEGVAVRAVGTAFNVRVRSDSVEVLVTEGRVRVASQFAATGRVEGTGEAAAELGAGERIVIRVSGAVSAAAPVVGRIAADEVQRALAWHSRRLEFSDTPLEEMVAEFNRYHRRPLRIADISLAELHFGGSFRPEDRTGFVRMLRENFGILAEETGDATVLRAAP
jgi:transmembrane sensor